MTGLAEARNTVSGAVLVLLGLTTVWATSELPTGRPAAADPGLLPRVVAVGLILVGLAMVVTDLVARRLGAATVDDAEGLPIDLPVEVAEDLRPEEEKAGRTEWLQVAGLAAAILAYSVAAFRLGFITSTAAFVLGAGLLLGRRRDPRGLVILAVFAVAVGVAYHVGFFELLNVRHPGTPLP